jgi:neutral ceramidase
LLERVLTAAPEPVFLRYGESRANHSINRRMWCRAPAARFPFWRRVMALHPNFQGPRDPTVRVLLASQDARGVKPVGVLWNYACHPVSTFPADRISSDYPGVTRRLLRERFGRDFPVVFLPGYAGNIRPKCIAHFPRQPYLLLHRLINGPVFGQFGLESGDAWRRSLAGVVGRAASFNLRPREVREIRCGMLNVPLEELMENGRGRNITFQVARLDPLVTIVGISAEPVVEYVAALREMLAPRTFIPVGYTGAVAAYLPTSTMLAEGGLEVTSPGYGLTQATFREDISQLVRQRIQRLLEGVSG